MILYMVISLSFNQAFFALESTDCFGESRGSNSYHHTWYQIFLLSLNIVEERRMHGRFPELAWGWRIFVIVYIFIVAVLMINFLIAVMANAISILGEHHHIVWTANKQVCDGCQ